MENLISRHRNISILVAVLFAQVFGLAVQVKRSGQSEETRLIRIWTVGAVTPFEKALVWTQSSVSNTWHNYLYLRGVRAENRDLKQQIEKLRLEQVRLSEDAEQARRLQLLLGFKEKFIAKTVPAQVIGSSGSDQSRTVYIDKGSADGIKPDQAVMTADGVVGKVIDVYQDHTAKILLVNDQTSGVGVVLEKSRLQGILRGTPLGELMVEKILNDESVQAGERVLTSGGDQIFPKGLEVGVVSKVELGSDSFLKIRLKAAANLSKLEEVLVVTQVETRTPSLAEAGGRQRAADILAERLPSVPPKPAADAAKSAASAPSTSSGTSGTATTSAAKRVSAPDVQKPVAAGSAGTVTQSPVPKAASEIAGSGSGSTTGATPKANSSATEKASSPQPSGTKPVKSTILPTAGGNGKPALVTKPKTDSAGPTLSTTDKSASPVKTYPAPAPPEDNPQ